MRALSRITLGLCALLTGCGPGAGEPVAGNRPTLLAPEFETTAERIGGSGYRTFLWAANPHVSKAHGLGQGFQTELRPWSPDWQDRALTAARAAAPEVSNPGLHATGELANAALLDWFAFVNLMEAHRPYLPRAEHLEELGGIEGARAVRELGDGFPRMRAFNLGTAEYSPGELGSVAPAYDACFAPLDELFEVLIGELEEWGQLENTLVVLTSDHGEHLGERHFLDHQFSINEELLHVPLIVRAPTGLRGTQLFDMSANGEAHNLAEEDPDRRRALVGELNQAVKHLRPASRVLSRPRPKDKERLEALGYAGD